MPGIVYGIEAERLEGGSLSIGKAMSASCAARLARQACRDFPKMDVFVSFTDNLFKAKGFYNPDGNHDPVRMAWNGWS